MIWRGAFNGLLGALLLALAGTAGAVCAGPIGPFSLDGVPIVIDHKIASDGTEVLLTQIHDDAYAVRLNVRRGGLWSQYWLANDDAFWRGDIELRPATTIAVVRNYGREMARFDWSASTLIVPGKLPSSQVTEHVLVGDPYAWGAQ